MVPCEQNKENIFSYSFIALVYEYCALLLNPVLIPVPVLRRIPAPRLPWSRQVPKLVDTGLKEQNRPLPESP